jgi:hypothetical protein
LNISLFEQGEVANVEHTFHSFSSRKVSEFSFEVMEKVELSLINYSCKGLELNDENILKLVVSLIGGDYKQVLESELLNKSLQSLLKENKEGLTLQDGLFLLIGGISCLNIFLQANWTGPPLKDLTFPFQVLLSSRLTPQVAIYPSRSNLPSECRRRDSLFEG